MKKRLKQLSLLMLTCMIVGMNSCKEEEEEPGISVPTIALDNQTATYLVKIGKTITITPGYTNAETAIFAWKTDGKIVANSPQFEYKGTELGDKYVSLSVINRMGEAYAEMKISVVDRLLPEISMTVPEDGYTVVRGGDLVLSPVVGNAGGATYSWSVNGEQKAVTKDFTFNSGQTGNFALRLTATNEDGSVQMDVPVRVCKAEEIPFSWFFDQTVYNLSQGRKIQLSAYDIENDFDAEYVWTVNGVEKQRGKSTAYVFSETAQGACEVVVTMQNQYIQSSQKLTVNVCGPEGTYKRTVSGASTEKWNKVYEFTAAPGQFVNEGYAANTAAEAATYVEGRFRTDSYVSLGGFGGCVVVGFDHSIENDGSYNIQIKGNSFAGSSEPGVVWVMQDENGNGLPDDTWYELKGSEYRKAGEIRNYAITYYRPKSPGMSVQWTDNQGGSGVVDYLGFHQQDFYYPNWIKEDKYTLRGTCLPPSTRETSPGLWYNGEFEWGYADNFSLIDRLTNDINYGAAANGNHFRISDAVTFDGQPANLKYVDFVKVATGVNCKAGWLGEISVEVLGVNDFNMLKKK